MRAAGLGLLTLCAACASAQPQPVSAPAIVVETVTLDADGWKLVATLRRDANLAGPQPAAILLHRAAGNRSEYDALGQALAARGVAALQLDLRGHGDSVNKGRFIPEQSETRAINPGAWIDVARAYLHVSESDWADANRIAVLGASYSGERAAVAFRSGLARPAAVVMMGPGDFSDESVDGVDASGVPWLFVASENEIHWVGLVVDAVRERAATAEIRIVPGDAHASRILEAHPAMNAEIADWIADNLGAG